jgi:hypothetical protein
MFNHHVALRLVLFAILFLCLPNAVFGQLGRCGPGSEPMVRFDENWEPAECICTSLDGCGFCNCSGSGSGDGTPMSAHSISGAWEGEGDGNCHVTRERCCPCWVDAEELIPPANKHAKIGVASTLSEEIWLIDADVLIAEDYRHYLGVCQSREPKVPSHSEPVGKQRTSSATTSS